MADSRIEDARRLTGTSAKEIAGSIRVGDVSVSEIVAAHIARIEEVNPRLNAVVTTTFDQARREAAEADRRITEEGTDRLPPLFGVPVTVKDVFPVEGVRFTAGSWFHRDDVADSDALAVKRLREAGAVILGKTNLPDMAWGIETVNPVFGRTESARGVGLSAGGSSGGEAAIITAGGSALGLGSDIGGSVRNPAAHNGCVSLKPTAGRVPTDGHLPVIPEEVSSWLAAGPLARRVEDLALALGVLDGQGEVHLPDIEGVRCRVFTGNRLMPVKREVKSSVRSAADALKQAGMSIGESPALPIQRFGILYAHLLRKFAIPELNKQLGGGQSFKWTTEMRRAWKGDPRISVEALSVYGSIAFGGLLKPGSGDPLKKLERLTEQMIEGIGDGVLLCPLLLSRPPRHGATWRTMIQVPMALPFNMTGLPAVIVPAAWTDDGLPLAVQIVAGPGNDELALAAAQQVEQQLGGWRPTNRAGQPHGTAATHVEN